MGQFIFFALFMITILAGAFSYFAPAHKNFDPLKLLMDSAGLSSEDAQNNKRMEQLDVTTSSGLVKVRKQMDDIAKAQAKYLNMIQDQQDVVKNMGHDAQDIMIAAAQNGSKSEKDLLQVQAFGLEIQDQDRLLASQGQELLALNDKLQKSRDWVAEQIALGNINNDTSLRMFREHYSRLKDQTSDFFDRVIQHNNDIRDQMGKVREHVREYIDNEVFNASQDFQMVTDRMERMVDKEHDDLIKLAEDQERSRDLVKSAEDKFINSQELFNDSLQRTQDLIDEEHQKQQEQQWASQERQEAQMQRIQALQNR